MARQAADLPGLALAIIFVGLVVFLALFVALLIPLLAREVPQFAAALPGYLADLQRRDDWLGNAFRHANVSAEVRQFIADLPSKIGDSFTAILGAAGTAFGRVFDVFTVGILCIYFMVALPRLPATIAKLAARTAGPTSTCCSNGRSTRSAATSPAT